MPQSHSWSRLVAASAVALLLAACGTPSTKDDAGATGGGASGGGTGGSASPTACTRGCWLGDACALPPNSSFDTTCGGNGGACVDCTLTGKTCSSVTHTCVPHPDAGTSTATGGGMGGGSGGGTGGGVSTCDGCMVGSVCVTLANTSVLNCGVGGAQCQACITGAVCTDGACVGPAPTVGTIGDRCVIDADCNHVNGGGGFCKRVSVPGNVTYPEGYCAQRCTTQAQCGAGAHCSFWMGFLGEAENLCLRDCPDWTCRPGYTCMDIGNGSAPMQVCLPSAVVNGTPLDAGVGTTTAAGAACTADAQCGPAPSFACLPAQAPSGAATGFTGGMCTADCSVSLTDTWCGASGACLPFVTRTDSRGPQVAWQCRQTCTPGAATSTCRSGYICDTFDGTTGFCTPDCRTAPTGFCRTGACDSTGACK